MIRQASIFFAFLVPTQALAYDFGFVRGPDWMNPYLVILLALTAVGLVLTLMFKPSGVPFNEMYKHFGEFSPLGRLVYVLFGLSIAALMAMVFLGMGLQRATEAGL